MMSWQETKERWLPLVQEMERMGFGDYAEPEIFRAADSRIKELQRQMEILPSIKIADGTVWLVFPGAIISIDAIGAGRGPIVKKNLRKWRDTLLEQEKG